MKRIYGTEIPEQPSPNELMIVAFRAESELRLYASLALHLQARDSSWLPGSLLLVQAMIDGASSAHLALAADKLEVHERERA